jgi:hypothetical protein
VRIWILIAAFLLNLPLGAQAAPLEEIRRILLNDALVPPDQGPGEAG